MAQKLKSRFKRNDQVIVIAGKDKGKKGNILKILPYKTKTGRKHAKAVGMRIVVEGINLVKKHVKSTQDQPGEIITKESPLDASNIRILNPVTDKMDKIGYKILENGNKVRIFKSNGEVIDA